LRTRFAPAPTGYLHLGHVLNADQVWGAASREGAEVLLRIEDHDRERSRGPFETAILEDLDWLGFRPDIFPTAEFRAGRCDGRQSDREPHYRAAAARLGKLGLLYACSCSRSDLAAADRSPAGESIYSGRCRERGLELAAGVGWRVRIEPGLERFEDLALGPQLQDPPRQSGDVLIRDRRGNWTYQFAVAVDDLLQEIDLVVRGIDLLESTGRQLRLARLLGRTSPPRFLHHALIMKSPSRKLSKSDGDTAIRSLRAQGWTAAQVIDAARARVAAQHLTGSAGLGPT
jgi:glutamyl-tRNA synthetase/glutamyl-Q tRNA(Asp) synthetase